MRLKDPPLLAAAVSTGALVALAGHLNHKVELIWLFHPLPLLLALVVAWQRGRLANHYAQFITLGLVLSLIADVLRIASGQWAAAAGVALLASLSTLRAFTAEFSLRLVRWPLVLGLVFALAVILVLWPVLHGSLTFIVPGGLLVLGLTAGQAGERARVLSRNPSHEGRPGGTMLAALGAMLLLLSCSMALIDLLRWPNPWSAIWILVTWWAGQTMLALSIPERHDETPRVG